MQPNKVVRWCPDGEFLRPAFPAIRVQHFSDLHSKFTGDGQGQTSCKVWLASVEWRRCSNEVNTRKPLKFAGLPQTRQPISAANGPKFAILWGHVEEILLFHKFFPIVNTCLSCQDIARHICAMVPRWLIFMAALWNGAGHYTFALWFLSSISLFFLA